MVIARTILIWSLSGIGVIGLLGCLAAVFVPQARLPMLFRSSNVLRGDSQQTSVQSLGMSRSGLFVHATHRDWTGEESVFHSTWQTTEFRMSDAVAPQTSTLGFAG